MNLNDKEKKYTEKMERCLFMHRQLLLLADKKITGSITIHFKEGDILHYETKIRKNLKLEP